MFFIIFSVHLFGRRPAQIGVLCLMVLGAALALFGKAVDPFAWFFYTVFSMVIFLGAFQFRRWSLAESIAMDEELDQYTRKVKSAEAVLEEKKEEADEIRRRANAIAHLYETIQEISKSLDSFEAFVVFGQALYNHFEFSAVTAAFFDGESLNPREPSEVFRLAPPDFSGVFDKTAFLKDKEKYKIVPAAFERKIFEAVFKDQRPLNTVDPMSDTTRSPIRLWPDFKPFAAYPIFIEGRIFSILVLSGVTEEHFQALSILSQRLISEMQRIRLYQKIQTLAITDGLTGVSVRRYWMERFEGELARSRKLRLKLSLLMIDIDNFKKFNDLYGHLVGDAVLKQVADTLKKNIREIDLVGRYGGEEFAVLLIETDESVAFFVAERIRRAVQERIIRAYDENLQVTLSIGCTTLSNALKDATVLIDAADAGLYQAKREGKNRVCFHTGLSTL
ncbi:MAG: hypothetical protein A3C47_03365 [Omnitrophica bacterium RIFCSPHIGHO2_02_FULL_51_18]|nr:MAG: hypothetical protein A3C47_03365 [Omnitrophica bacterium RIFCSPHIGHO2_02_FULL_51_18]